MPVVCRCVRVRGLCLCVYKPVYVREEVCLCKCVHVQAGVCMGGACPCVGNCVCVCVCEGGSMSMCVQVCVCMREGSMPVPVQVCTCGGGEVCPCCSVDWLLFHLVVH